MKKIYVTLAIVFAIAAGLSNKASAITIVRHNEYDSCGAPTTYTFVLSSQGTNLSAMTWFGDGSSAAVSMGGTYGYNYHNFQLPGIYTIKHVLYQSGVPIDSVIFTDTIMCQIAYIAAYNDVNNNCTRDLSEPFLWAPVDVEIDSAGVKIDTISMIGGAYRQLTPGKTYSMRLLNLPPGLSVSCPSTGVITTTIASSGPTVFAFGLQCGSSSGFDIAENVTVRAGRHSEWVDVIVSNNTCNSQNVTLTANLSPKYPTQISAYPTPASVTGNTMAWNLPNVSAFAGYHVYVHCETAPGTGTSTWQTPGDTIHTSFYVTPTTGDVNVSNNSVVRVDTILSSWDPNAKTVYPQGDIAAGTTLQYSIEFENDGNAPAQNIHILDTLSGNLDLNSLKVISSSAPVTNVVVTQSGSNNILRFDMPGINLPDSSHHGQCTGMVVYAIKARASLAAGTVITNRAGIYFDDNEVVMTGNTQNKIVKPSSVKPVAVQELSAYPNPVHDVLNIKGDGRYQSIQLINTLGQVVLEKNISGNTAIDVRALSNGIYYVVLKGHDGTIAQKIEKQ